MERSGKKRAMKKGQRRTEFLSGWMMVLVCLAVAGGCGYSREPAVVGKAKGPAGERGDIPAVPDDSGGNRGEHAESFLAMLDIPDRYDTRIEEDGVVLTADAVVEIPDAGVLGCHEIISESFTEEEFERIGRSVAERLGMDWQKKEEQAVEELEPVEEVPDGTRQESRAFKGRQLRTYKVEDKGKRYQVDFLSFAEPVREENGEISPSFIWWVNRDDKKWKGSPAGSETFGKSDPAVAERLPAAEAFEEDAGKLLKEWGMEEYEVWETWWMKTGYSDGADEYRYQIRYTPVYEGIPFGRNKGILEDGTEKMSLPYVRFDYLEDGTLDVVCLVGRCRVRQGKDKEMFLLPFQAVEELFEQYVRDYVREMSEEETADSKVSGQVPQQAVGWEEMPGEENPTWFIYVTRAVMEYAGVNNKGTKSENGKEAWVDSLVPVWTFYGYIREGSEQEEGTALSPGRTFFGITETGNPYREMPLLSVRADDGQTFMGK